MAHLEQKLLPYKDRPMWCMWRDFFTSTNTWRMKTPIGTLAFRTKKLATAAMLQYQKQHAHDMQVVNCTGAGKYVYRCSTEWCGYTTGGR